MLACTLQLTSAVNLVVIRDDDSASKSVEDEDEESDESSDDSDESRDIGMLVDLIEKATHQNQRKPAPARALRVVRRRPASKAAQASTRKERIQQTPKQPKEYHVHYHTHQHPKPPAEAVAFEEDRIKPILWESLSSHLNTYQDIYRKPKTTPLMSLSAAERFKQFKDFETLLQTSKKGGGQLPKFYDGSGEFPDHFDDAIVQHPPSPEKTTNEMNLERLKRYQALLRSRFRTHQPQKTSKENEDDFPNRERFAGFTDFSTLESSQPNQPSKPTEVQKPKQEAIKEGDDLEIRDFAIVIKTKPRTVPLKKDPYNGDGKGVSYRTMDRPSNRPSDKDRPDEPRPRRPFSVPRILEAPGGAPQFIEKLHQAKYGKVDKLNLNSIESQQRQRFQMRPGLRPGLGNHVYNGWIIQRWMR